MGDKSLFLNSTPQRHEVYSPSSPSKLCTFAHLNDTSAIMQILYIELLACYRFLACSYDWHKTYKYLFRKYPETKNQMQCGVY